MFIKKYFKHKSGETSTKNFLCPANISFWLALSYLHAIHVSHPVLFRSRSQTSCRTICKYFRLYQSCFYANKMVIFLPGHMSEAVLPIYLINYLSLKLTRDSKLIKNSIQFLKKETFGFLYRPALLCQRIKYRLILALYWLKLVKNSIIVILNSALFIIVVRD